MAQSLLTPEMLESFQQRGGEVKRLNTMSPVTGQIRGYMAQKRQEYIDEGVSLDDMPTWCLTYAEKKERRLLPHQIRADQRRRALKKGA